MLVEGTLRWQVTEDCPWDLLMALALRDLGHLDGVGVPAIPRLSPAVASVFHGATAAMPLQETPPQPESSRSARSDLDEPWLAWFELTVDRERRPLESLLRPPHFEAFDRAIDLQDLIEANYEVAVEWVRDRHLEYERTSIEHHAQRAADIVDIVHAREHELRRQAGYFRLDLYVLPLAASGTWIVAPHTVIVSTTLRDDPGAFREWFAPVVAALV